MLRYLKIVETLLIQNERFESEKRKGIKLNFPDLNPRVQNRTCFIPVNLQQEFLSYFGNGIEE